MLFSNWQGHLRCVDELSVIETSPNFGEFTEHSNNFLVDSKFKCNDEI